MEGETGYRRGGGVLVWKKKGKTKLPEKIAKKMGARTHTVPAGKQKEMESHRMGYSMERPGKGSDGTGVSGRRKKTRKKGAQVAEKLGERDGQGKRKIGKRTKGFYKQNRGKKQIPSNKAFGAPGGRWARKTRKKWAGQAAKQKNRAKRKDTKQKLETGYQGRTKR